MTFGMTNLAKSLNYWNLAIGKGSEDLLSSLILKGCIFESEEKITFFIKDKENKAWSWTYKFINEPKFENDDLSND